MRLMLRVRGPRGLGFRFEARRGFDVPARYVYRPFPLKLPGTFKGTYRGINGYIGFPETRGSKDHSTFGSTQVGSWYWPCAKQSSRQLTYIH